MSDCNLSYGLNIIGFIVECAVTGGPPIKVVTFIQAA